MLTNTTLYFLQIWLHHLFDSFHLNSVLKLKEGEETKLALIFENKIWYYHGNLSIVVLLWFFF